MRLSLAQLGVLLFLSLLAALSWWLERRPATTSSGPQVELPAGFEARGINIAQYLPGGALQYRLLASSMKQYGLGVPTTLQTAVLEHFDAKGPVTRFVAPLAQWHEDSNIMQFPQQLTVTRPAVARTPALRFEAAQVQVDNARQTVVGSGPVKAWYGRSTLQGVGLEYDWARRQLVLKSRVRMVYAKTP